MEFLEGKTVGIDLGTTFSTLAIVNEEGEPTPIPNEDDEVETASLILLTESKHLVVGPNRNRAAMEDPENVIERIKRQMGTTGYHRVFDGQEITPEVVSSWILRKLRQDSERRIGSIANAVITVPAYFNDTRRKSTIDAGRMIGLNVVDIINEPTAAALTYAWHRGELGRSEHSKKRRILIYDLGGGTFDSTVVEYSANSFHVVTTDGDVKLGGVDWNDRLADYVCEEFLKKHALNLHLDPRTMQILRNDCDAAKIQLTTREQTTISCRYEGKSISVPVTRQLFEELTYDLLQRTADTTQFVVESAGMKFSDLDAIVMIGGSTLMPQVPAMLEKLTGQVPYKNPDLDPHTAVARGAAIHAAILEAQNNKNSELSDRVKKLLENVREENVNSHGLGIVMQDSKAKSAVNYIMIPRNTTLPCSISKTFQTVKDGQTRISVQVVEGDAPDPTACALLGKCRIVDLPANLPKGTPVEVTYSFDKMGRISVAAREKLTNQEADIDIERRGVLSDEEFEKFIRLAEEYMIE